MPSNSEDENFEVPETLGELGFTQTNIEHISGQKGTKGINWDVPSIMLTNRKLFSELTEKLPAKFLSPILRGTGENVVQAAADIKDDVLGMADLSKEEKDGRIQELNSSRKREIDKIRTKVKKSKWFIKDEISQDKKPEAQKAQKATEQTKEPLFSEEQLSRIAGNKNTVEEAKAEIENFPLLFERFKEKIPAHYLAEILRNTGENVGGAASRILAGVEAIQPAEMQSSSTRKPKLKSLREEVKKYLNEEKQKSNDSKYGIDEPGFADNTPDVISGKKQYAIDELGFTEDNLDAISGKKGDSQARGSTLDAIENNKDLFEGLRAKMSAEDVTDILKGTGEKMTRAASLVQNKLNKKPPPSQNEEPSLKDKTELLRMIVEADRLGFTENEINDISGQPENPKAMRKTLDALNPFKQTIESIRGETSPERLLEGLKGSASQAGGLLLEFEEVLSQGGKGVDLADVAKEFLARDSEKKEPATKKLPDAPSRETDDQDLSTEVFNTAVAFSLKPASLDNVIQNSDNPRETLDLMSNMSQEILDIRAKGMESETSLLSVLANKDPKYSTKELMEELHNVSSHNTLDNPEQTMGVIKNNISAKKEAADTLLGLALTEANNPEIQRKRSSPSSELEETFAERLANKEPSKKTRNNPPGYPR